MNPQFGKILIVLGIVIVVIGAAIVFQDRLPFLKYFGRLPGDIRVEGENYKVYFPIATSILLSILLSLIFALFSRR